MHGFPRYVQFDNGSVFAGAPKPDCVGQVIRMCLQLGITPVFAPPRTHGPQNAIEGYNAKWKRGVWRFHFDSFEEVCAQSTIYVAARNAKNAASISSAPSRRPLPLEGIPNPDETISSGKIIFLRRVDESGTVEVLQRPFLVSEDLANQTLRCEIDITHNQIKFYTLSRSSPEAAACVRDEEYIHPLHPLKRPPRRR